MKFKLILASIIFLTLACSKEDGIIEGTVLEEHYDTPRNNVNVLLSSVAFMGGNQQFEASTLTDNNGQYKINYNFNSNKHYQLQLGNDFFHISTKKTTIDLKLSPISNLKYRLKNNRTHEIQLSLSSEEVFHIINCRLKAKADSLIPNHISVNGFGKTALSYSIISTQQPIEIHHDTISIFTKTDTVIHLIEIN